MAVGVLTDAHGWSEHAAAQAGDFFQGEDTLGIRVLLVRYLQLVAKFGARIGGPPDVTGRADANLDEVFSRRSRAEAWIKGDDTGQIRGRDGSVVQYQAEGLRRQVAEALLNGEKDRDQGVGVGSPGGDNVFDVFPVDVVHGRSSPIQKRCLSPRR